MILITAVLSAACLAGCGKRVSDPVSRSSFLLNTFVTISLYEGGDEAVLDGCLELCAQYEDMLSKTREGSEIYKLNHRAPSRPP